MGEELKKKKDVSGPGLVERLQNKVSCLRSRGASFFIMTFLLGGFFLIEVVIGYITNSMALIADSFHILSDVASLIVGYLALRLSTASSPRDSYTYGYARAEVMGALVNAVFLVALCFTIFLKAIKRLAVLEGIEDPVLVFFVGLSGLIVNMFGMLLFHQTGHGHSHGGGHGHSHGGISPGHSHNDKSHGNLLDEDTGPRRSHRELMEAAKNTVEKPDRVGTKRDDVSLDIGAVDEAETGIKPGKNARQLNMEGVYRHILGDALGSIIVMISAVILIFARGEWTLYVDPSMSIAMVIIILNISIPLLIDASKILMNSVPQHIQINDLRNRLLSTIPEIKNIHELHVWQLAGDKIIASVHVMLERPEVYSKTAVKIKDFFHDEGIHSTTVQMEFLYSGAVCRGQCMVVCSLDSACDDMMCCKPGENDF